MRTDALLLPDPWSSLCLNPFFFVLSAKVKGQSAKVSINPALVEDIVDLDEVKTDMAAVLTDLKDDFTRSLSIRTSPGNPPPTPTDPPKQQRQQVSFPSAPPLIPS